MISRLARMLYLMNSELLPPPPSSPPFHIYNYVYYCIYLCCLNWKDYVVKMMCEGIMNGEQLTVENN
jgi:hypothetical protein